MNTTYSKSYIIEITVLWAIKQYSFDTFHEQAETLSHGRSTTKRSRGMLERCVLEIHPPIINTSAGITGNVTLSHSMCTLHLFGPI